MTTPEALAAAVDACRQEERSAIHEQALLGVDEMRELNEYAFADVWLAIAEVASNPDSADALTTALDALDPLGRYSFGQLCRNTASGRRSATATAVWDSIACLALG